MANRKLLLDRETVRNLSANRLAEVVGGTARSVVGSDLAHGCATASCSTASASYPLYTASCGTYSKIGSIGGSGGSAPTQSSP